MLLLFFAPFWLVFEAGQLIVAERYLGIKQIEAGIDPREFGPPRWIAMIWSSGLICYWCWMAMMVSAHAQVMQVFAMLVVSTLGFLIRRSCALKWVLVTLTFEGAIRIGMLLSICGLLWRNAQ